MEVHRALPAILPLNRIDDEMRPLNDTKDFFGQAEEMKGVLG